MPAIVAGLFPHMAGILTPHNLIRHEHADRYQRRFAGLEAVLRFRLRRKPPTAIIDIPPRDRRKGGSSKPNRAFSALAPLVHSSGVFVCPIVSVIPDLEGLNVDYFRHSPIGPVGSDGAWQAKQERLTAVITTGGAGRPFFVSAGHSRRCPDALPGAFACPIPRRARQPGTAPISLL